MKRAIYSLFFDTIDGKGQALSFQTLPYSDDEIYVANAEYGDYLDFEYTWRERRVSDSPEDLYSAFFWAFGEVPEGML